MSIMKSKELDENLDTLEKKHNEPQKPSVKKVPKIGELMYLEQQKYHKLVGQLGNLQRNDASSFKPCLACLLFVNPSKSAVVEIENSKDYVVHQSCLDYVDLLILSGEEDKST